jgi:hypothetical protein
MRVELTLSALLMAIQRQRPPTGLLQHSDRGSQYAAEAYGAQLTAIGAVPSMSRKGCCYDNAPVESFFHTLKVKLAHGKRWASRDDPRRNLFAYIEGYYNRAACTRPSAISRPSSAWQAKPLSTQMREDHPSPARGGIGPECSLNLPAAAPLEPAQPLLQQLGKAVACGRRRCKPLPTKGAVYSFIKVALSK